MTQLWQRLLMQQSAPPAAAGYRYWQLHAYTNNGDPNTAICEIELRAAPGGATLTTPSTPAVASSFISPYGADRSINGTLDFSSVWIATGATNQSVSYDLGAPAVVREIAIFPSGYSPKRNPKHFVMRGSNASIAGPWTDVKTFDEVNLSTTWKTYSLD